jgi:superfamily II DNA or RNA helicase
MNWITDAFRKKNEEVVIPTTDFLARLYPYQREAVNETLTNTKGIVCMPTGVGKTFCQAAIIADDIAINPNQFRMYVINAPRIMLSYQLLKEVYGFLMEAKIQARYMFVHSGGKTDEKELEMIRMKSKDDDGNVIPFSEIGSGTSTTVIREMMTTAKRQGLPLIFFSTYNSAERIEEARVGLKEPISIVLNDEAHYLVQEQFHDILRTLPSPRTYFFTATTIHTPSDKGRGMNNVELYGEQLYSMLPIDAIKLGKMVRPRMHIVRTENIGVYTPDDFDRSLSKIIKESFIQHESVLGKVKPKILISTKGTKDIVDFLKSPEYRQLRDEGVDVYAVSSNEEIGNLINPETINNVIRGGEISRQGFLKSLKKDGEDVNKRLIVLHYDILAEGIDVSGFTGILPLRTLNKSKFLQTFGRAARPDKEDRIKITTLLKDGRKKDVISTDEWNGMNKPYSYIIIPNVIHSNEDDMTNMKNLIEELRTYGFDPSEDIVSSSVIHIVPTIEDPPIDIPTNPRNNGVMVERLIMEIEDTRRAEIESKLDPVALLKEKFNL